MNRRTILTLTIAAFMFLGQSAFAADPTITGTWELNVAKSKTTNPMPKSITRTYEVTGNQEKMTATTVTADGKSVPSSFTASADGKDYPFQDPNGDTIAITKVDALTNSFVVKKAGKTTLTGTRTIAKDGKTMTIASKGTNAEGKPTEATMVYDRK